MSVSLGEATRVSKYGAVDQLRQSRSLEEDVRDFSLAPPYRYRWLQHRHAARHRVATYGPTLAAAVAVASLGHLVDLIFGVNIPRKICLDLHESPFFERLCDLAVATDLSSRYVSTEYPSFNKLLWPFPSPGAWLTRS